MKIKKSYSPFRQELFWDVDPTAIEPQKHARYIIERILDFGSIPDIQWMWNTYEKKVIRRVVLRSRSLHKRTKPLWLLLTDGRR